MTEPTPERITLAVLTPENKLAVVHAMYATCSGLNNEEQALAAYQKLKNAPEESEDNDPDTIGITVWEPYEYCTIGEFNNIVEDQVTLYATVIKQAQDLVKPDAVKVLQKALEDIINYKTISFTSEVLTPVSNLRYREQWCLDVVAIAQKALKTLVQPDA